MDSIHWIGRTLGCGRPMTPQTERSRVGVVSGDGGGVPVSARSPLPRQAVQPVGSRRSLLTLLAATVALVTSPLAWAAEGVSLSREVLEEPVPSPAWEPAIRDTTTTPTSTPTLPPLPTTSSSMNLEPSPVPSFSWEATLAELNEGLVEYWPLQSASYSLKGKGTVSGTVGYDPSGPLAGAAIFDGATYIYGPASGFPTASRTVVLNFYPTALDPAWYLFSYGGGSCGNSFFLYFDRANTAFVVHRHCPNNEIGYSEVINPILMLDRWNQLAMTMGIGGTKLFLNNRKIMENPAIYTNTNVSGKLFCIARVVTEDGNGCYLNMFPGKLSDIRLWNRALSESEVKAVGCFDSNHSGGKLVMEGGCAPFPEEFITEPLYPAGHSGTATLPKLVRYYPFQGNLLDYGPFQHPFTALGSGLRHTAEGVQVTASTLLRASASDLGAFERTVSMTFKNLDLAVGKSTWFFSVNGYDSPETCGRGYGMFYGYPSGDTLRLMRSCSPNLIGHSYPRNYFDTTTHVVASTSKLGRTCFYVNGEKLACQIQFPVSIAPHNDEYVSLFWGAKRDGYLYTAEPNLVASGGTVREFSILNGAVSDSQVREMWRQLMSPSPSATPPAASASASACPPAPSQSMDPSPVVFPTCPPAPSQSECPAPPTCPPKESEVRTFKVCGQLKIKMEDALIQYRRRLERLKGKS